MPHPPSTSGQDRFEQHLRAQGYSAVEEIGEGAQGKVYRAYSEPEQRLVAIKCLHESKAPARFATIQREARILAKMPKHQNIVTIYGVGEFEHSIYIIMEFVGDAKTGVTRDIGSRVWSQEGAVKLLIDISEALSTAHRANVIHRDLKPQHVLMRKDEIPVIVDFGLAHEAPCFESPESPQGSLTILGAGTPPYMAPEQALGSGSFASIADNRSPIDSPSRKSSRDDWRISAKTDVWALGMMLAELLAERESFATITGMFCDPPRTSSLWQHLQSTIEKARQRISRILRRKGISPSLVSVCLKCLEGHPSQRYPSTLDLAKDLKSFLDTGTTRAHIDDSAWFSRPAQILCLGLRERAVSLRAITVCTIFACILATFLWHYYWRPTPRYYENYTYRWGQPMGVRQITANVISHRYSSYRIWTRGTSGRVIQCDHIDAHGALSPDFRINNNATIEVVYENHSRSNRVRLIRFKDTSGALSYEKHHDYSAQDSSLRISYKSGMKSGRISTSPITAMESSVYSYIVFLDERGFEKRRVFLDSEEAIIHDLQGAAGYDYTIDEETENGQILMCKPIGPNLDGGIHHVLSNGVANIRYEYDNHSRRVATHFLDKNHNHINILSRPEPHLPSFWVPTILERVISSQAGQDNKVLKKESVPNIGPKIQARAFRAIQGFCTITNTYDPFGNLTSVTFFSTDGSPGISKSGFHKLRIDYSEPENKPKFRYYGPNNQLLF